MRLLAPARPAAASLVEERFAAGCLLAALLGIALMTTGCSGGAPPPPAAQAAIATLPVFTDITAEAGVAFTHNTGAFGKKYLPETMGSGAALFDADGDGRLDIYLVNGADWPSHHRETTYPVLYRNLGEGRFEEITERAGLKHEFYGLGVAAADHDNDGDQDLFVTALGPDRLYRNDGGAFTEVGAAAGVADPGFGTSALFFDPDKDGDLDLVVANYVAWTEATDLTCILDGVNKSYCTPEGYPGEGPTYFRNEGGGRFVEASRASGIGNGDGKSLGVALLDFDSDGWVDLAVANDTQPNYLYRNNRDGTFTDGGRESGVAFSEAGVARGAMGIDAADYDGSGRESLVIGNFSNEMVGLYHNEGGGLFIDDAPRAGIGQPSLLTLAFGTFFFDYDLDGRLDIFVANGHVEDDINRIQREVTYAQKPHLFRNVGDGKFEPAGAAAGEALSVEMVARGAAYGDVDEDGDLDILVTTSGGAARLLRNDGGNSASWLRVALTGSASNRDAIGAVVTVRAGGRAQSRMVRSGSSYCSSSEKTLTFGLGAGDVKVESIEIAWPSGTRQTFRDVAARRLIRVDESAGLLP